jgi:ParB family transcriptional regulator, chromosome partitioning protein
LEEMPDADAWGAALDGLPSGDRAPFQQMTFTLSDEQAGIVKEALEHSKRVSPFIDTGNENSNGNALARVCELYLGQS